MNPSSSQFPISHVKVHESLLTPGNPDTYKRSKLRGALRTKSKLDAFGSSEESGYKYKGKEHFYAPDAVNADENKNGTYIISDNPDKNPTRFKQ
jgi:hypothetical protein